MKHYVIVLDWANNDAEGVNILGVTHTFNEAKEIFAEHVIEERELAEGYGWNIETDTDSTFEAYEDGYHAVAHTTLYIEEVRGNEN